MKVLYIDDEKINILIFKKIFEKKYTVVTAESGQEALDVLAKETDIEHIITDLRMPGMSGWEFIQEARKNFVDKKYFILSGYAINSEIQQALDSKLILSYFMKPANFEEIDKALSSS